MSDLVAKHYEDVLAKHYSWMTGMPFEEKVAEQRQLLCALGIGPRIGGAAVDLGCGNGYQSFALAELGAAPVWAFDTSAYLLNELEARNAAGLVRPVNADICQFGSNIQPQSVKVVVCMGDTITHLPSRDAVRLVLDQAANCLVPGGKIALTFRDLSIEVTGADRVIPVRSEPDQIMICVLDYKHDRVGVTDIIYTRDGLEWHIEKSCYEKLRLAPSWLAAELTARQFRVLRNETVGRLHAITAEYLPS